MAKPIITVDLSDLHRLRAKVAGIASDKEVLRDVAKGLAVASEVQTDRRFDRRQSPDGRKWAERQRPTANPILEKSGDLRRSVKGEGTADEVKLSSRLPHSAVHQFGRTRREYLGWSGDDLTELGGLAEDRLASFVGGSFAGETL